jgi:crossover junction endodeoxyribonuclease RuvC
MQFKLPVTEYAPKKVKQSITGNGNADKDMVWKMLERILDLKKQPQYFDATDALGVALCHWYQMSSPVMPAAKGLKGWDAFLAKNPGRQKLK